VGLAPKFGRNRLRGLVNMAFERKLAAVPPQAFTADGTSTGVVTIADTTGFYIKSFVYLKSDTLQSAGFQVKNVLSNTQLILGPADNSLRAPLNPTNLSAYLVSDDATISAPEQDNFTIKPDDHYLATFLPAPVSADRVVPVDPHGNFYDAANPLPISFDGTVNIGDVHILGPAPSNNELEVNLDGSINNISLAQLIPVEFNEIDLTNSTIGGQVVPTIVTYKQASVTVATLTLSYDGSANLLSVVRT